MIQPLYPRPVKAGDTVAIMAPAGQLQDRRSFVEGVRILKEMGFEVKFPRELWPGTDYLADSDERRGDEFNQLLRDEEVQALVSMRGGYGCLRILERIDLDLVSRFPKTIVGFSDISILQNYLQDRTGLVSMHGPVVTTLAGLSHSALSRFFSCLTGNWRHHIRPSGIEVIKSGSTSTALLAGGNLTSLVTMLGTKYDCSWVGKIVFIEDVNEPLYKVDRLLTQLHLAGKLHDLRGLLIGDFSLNSVSDPIEQLRYREAIWTRTLELCRQQTFPIWGNFPTGHCSNNLTLPIGSIATLNCAKTRLEFY